MMQSTGQTSMHFCVSCAPTHSVQRSGATMYVVPSVLIAWFGHSGSQAPQAMHSSTIFMAMTDDSCEGQTRCPPGERATLAPVPGGRALVVSSELCALASQPLRAARG